MPTTDPIQDPDPTGKTIVVPSADLFTGGLIADTDYQIGVASNTYPSPPGVTWTTTGTGSSWVPISPPDPKVFTDEITPEHPEYVNKAGEVFEAEQLVSDIEELIRIAHWLGAEIYGKSGLRVPTMDGVQALFIGDWAAKDENGIVHLYDNTDFANEFKRRT